MVRTSVSLDESEGAKNGSLAGHVLILNFIER